jgi:predicted amidohydrolase YtcJ
MRNILLTIAIAIFIFSCNQPEKESADKIYFNAKIWTADSANAWADAIAIKGNEIVYVGKDYQSFKGANTEMIDLGGKLMTPGFIDNHTHFLSGGYNLSAVDLRKAKTPQEFISILK